MIRSQEIGDRRLRDRRLRDRRLFLFILPIPPHPTSHTPHPTPHTPHPTSPHPTPHFPNLIETNNLSPRSLIMYVELLS
ncbi:hypothetical protein [Microcystis sp. LE19-195.1E]|uniref:hypothetical protein n=1 Tax=Microcystis sp. LE19-195.1E TaxID=3016440 RepID=UPI00258D72CA|nr:hypothetical protein [Microcystis sp. LE19-195.1E]